MRPIVSVVLVLIAMNMALASTPPPVDLPGQAPDEIVQASTQETPRPEETRRDTGWYVQPLTIGIGILALLLCVFLLTTPHRGGTTVVRR
ncbi:MAG: hypothetical protein ACREAA_11285 [Candidatus Polarisedimenticolia bacterium]